jgi:hypothetical protein
METESSERLYQLDRKVCYPEGWNKLSFFVRESTGHLCNWCLEKPSEETHHTQYWIPTDDPHQQEHGISPYKGRRPGAIGQGEEDAGKYLFGVCKSCHKILHQIPQNYIWEESDPLWLNRNTDEIVIRLRDNYRIARAAYLKHKNSQTLTHSQQENSISSTEEKSTETDFSSRFVVFAVYFFIASLLMFVFSLFYSPGDSPELQNQQNYSHQKH